VKKASLKAASKLHPRLRMYSNANSDVNRERAVQCAAMTPKVPVAKEESAPVFTAAEISRLSMALARPELRLDNNTKVNVFVQRYEQAQAASQSAGAPIQGGKLETQTLTPEQYTELARDPTVALIESGDTLHLPRTLVSSSSGVSKPASRSVKHKELHQDGAGLLVGIIDVAGFDFSHPDFLDSAGKTRWISIWDQGSSTRPAPQWAGFSYGSELTASQLNAALKAAKRLKVPAYRLEPQDQMYAGSHGTHVASIAAGNRGVASKAQLAGVLIGIPRRGSKEREEWERRGNFYDTTRLAHAVDYLLALGEKLGKVVVINISLGTNGHAHDASAAINRWIDSALTQPGRAVCTAAGNAGQDEPEFDTDLGYIMGRIHSSGRIASAGLDQDIKFVVGGNGIVDGSENELEIWYEPQDRFAVSLRPPGSSKWYGPVEPGEYVENKALPQKSLISIYNELYYQSNGCNLISVYLSPYFSSNAHVGIPSGIWTVRLHGRDVRDGRYHAWIERDDPGNMGAGLKSWPSRFTAESNVDNSSVSSLACANCVLGVANLNEADETINKSSSQGPTRDGRHKPDVAAPGTEIVAANGFAADDERWISMTGTSMASPYVTGVVGLMLCCNPELTAAQIEGIIHRTAKPLPGADYRWVDDAGFGRIDPAACVQEADRVMSNKEITL